MAFQADAAAGDCIYATEGPVLNGYDVVAYFSLDKGSDGVQGSSDYSTTYQSYTFQFSTAENLEMFESDPKRYLPQWGGFCAYGISEESWWTIDTLGPNANTDVWEIVDDKLYMFMYDTPRERFMDGNLTSEIAAGSSRWTGWFPEENVFNTGCYWFNKTSDSGVSKKAL